MVQSNSIEPHIGRRMCIYSGVATKPPAESSKRAKRNATELQEFETNHEARCSVSSADRVTAIWCSPKPPPRRIGPKSNIRFCFFPVGTIQVQRETIDG
jgi:hypothetical protein